MQADMANIFRTQGDSRIRFYIYNIPDDREQELAEKIQVTFSHLQPIF